MVRMAIEVGGTFTDLIWIEGGVVHSHKVPSTPQDASIGVLDGLNSALEGDLSGLDQLFHGSTVATNAVIERKGCRAALLTTAGFRDLLLLQRQLRPNVYAIACHKPEPLVPLNRSIEAQERVAADGQIVTPLDEAALIETLDLLLEKEQPEALAICLLHAYRNPQHEQRIREIIAERRPDLPVVLSSDVLPTFREYERASTTAMAAYLVPLVGRYLQRLEQHLERGFARVQPLHHAVLGRHPAQQRLVWARGRDAELRSGGGRDRGGADGGGHRRRQCHHAGCRRHQRRYLPHREAAPPASPRRPRWTVCLSAFPVSTSPISGRAAAALAGSTRAECCRSGRAPRARVRGPPATAMAARIRR